ncbi:zinc ribbon domain-containing protein [Acutalibacter sp. 1XD8-33]|uniref:zinc ribbon domain-containing protein n=1 Tax=Acutalibacter sp. 1XD8-33 TaxID=2320081 RepID=UPI000EA0668C|nr:zinc ribbon domain-containing protein [Acutalibacter sp. 1XD8-33]RKJ38496.1 zinc ribbon domain-containing protein [Acutalibacter sp. 1XD8-33]
MVCPRCKSQLPAGATSCPKCGARFSQGKRCPYCQSVIPASATACPKCGRPQPQRAAGAASQPAASQASQKGGFRWWYILIGVGVFILGLAIGYAAGSGTDKDSPEKKNESSSSSLASDSAASTEEVSLDGQWKQINSSSETSYQAAIVSGSTLEIYWINEEDSSRSLYWAGTVTLPENGETEFTWESKNDKEKTKAAILASPDDTKTFAYKDGIISYEVSAMGTTATVHLEKAEGTANLPSAITEPQITPEPQAQSDTSIQSAASLLEIAVKQGFQDNYTIDTQDEMIVISVWMDGVALNLSAIQEAGGDTNHPNWVEVKTALSSMYSSFTNLLETGGYPAYPVVINAINDLNHENTLLTIANGEIVYDVLAVN